ncbi:hypothetical protein TNCT_88031 [Trichonephila clavata]|uniref:Uncharacterized protein n=1 Tax=Trichonephila clavata TaxID=2740835 RepID=A0A8X6GQX3_TRICU|nr:hypothetical protein TNCT_88031 [Trichonephila clavata]
MLLEIPYMAAHELEGRRRMISKSFHHQLRNSERQALVGEVFLSLDNFHYKSIFQSNNVYLKKKGCTEAWEKREINQFH